jgi:sporulation protein YlmC with PRC-barrel domain
MLHKLLHDLRGDTIVCRDGEIGSLSDAYFDDEQWTLRYLVIDTGRWLPGRKALVSPRSTAEIGDDVMRLEISRQQIDQAPGIDADPPVSKLLQEASRRRYAYPYPGPYLWAMAPPPAAASQLYHDPAANEAARQAEERAAHTHLRSGSEVAGYRIRATDGEIGHVEDFLVDDTDWSIASMVVDTRNWLPGKKVVVPPAAVEHIDWDEGTVSVRLRRDELKQAPEAT